MCRKPCLFFLVLVGLLLVVAPAALTQEMHEEESSPLIKVTRSDPETGVWSRDTATVLHVPELYTHRLDGLQLVGLRVNVETGEIRFSKRQSVTSDHFTPEQPEPQGVVINTSFTQLSATCTDCVPIDCAGAPPPFPVSRTVVAVLDILAPGISHPPDWGAGNMTSHNYALTFVGQVPDGTAAVTVPPAATVTITITGDVQACDWFNVWFDMCQPDPASPTLACP